MQENKIVLPRKTLVWITVLLVAIGVCVIRFIGAAHELHQERVSNRHYASTMPNTTVWTLQDVRPNPNASPSRMDVTYVFQSEAGTMNLVVSLPNANKVWYDKVRPGDKISFLPTLDVGDDSPDPTLSAYIRPEVR